MTVLPVRFELSLVDYALEFPATKLQQDSQCTGNGQNNGNTTEYRNKTVCVGCTEITLILNVFLYSFVCLSCVVPASVHYRLHLVTVRMKRLQNETLFRFSKSIDCWCEFGWSICNQRVTSFAVSRAAVPKCLTAYTNQEKNSSAERNSGRQPKLS